MTRKAPYNPLDKLSLATSIERELLGQPEEQLQNAASILGAGVYAIYYRGAFPAYRSLTSTKSPSKRKPIYVGKAIPKGSRKGGLWTDVSSDSRALAGRLGQHATSVAEAANLVAEDFTVKYLLLDAIWIPLGENVLIETFRPVWNSALDGFGNHDPGERRRQQYKSAWDIVHPGRRFALKLADSPATSEALIKRIGDHFAGRPLTKLPRVLVEQEAKEKSEAQELIDEV